MTAVYTVPDNPPDPEAAALELIVRLPAQLMHTELIGWPTSFHPKVVAAISASVHVITNVTSSQTTEARAGKHEAS